MMTLIASGLSNDTFAHNVHLRGVLSPLVCEAIGLKTPILTQFTATTFDCPVCNTALPAFRYLALQ